jgi:hypothetical protein
MKAALLEVVSGMPRFYRGRSATAGLKACTTRAIVVTATRAIVVMATRAIVVQTFRSAVFAATVLFAGAAGAQPPSVIEQPLLGSTLTADVLRDLPTANNAFAVPETIQLETVGDLFSAGGLNAAGAAKIGGLLNSWTQTQYRVGDVAITDPRAGGTPLLLPFLPLWSRITIATGAMGLDDNASGVSMTLEPPRPAAAWTRTIDGSFSGSPLVAAGTGGVPAVDRVSGWLDGTAIVSGPITKQLGIVAAGSWRHLSHVAPPGTSDLTDRVASGFAHVVFAATPRDELRALGWAQQAATGARTDTALHLQATWERRDPANFSWRVFGGYTGRDRTETIASTLVVDSLDTDPVSDLVDTGGGVARRWTAGARVAAPPNRWLPSIGVDLDSAEVRVTPTPIQQIRELVNGVPARVWSYRANGSTDVRQLTTIAAYANEHVTSGRLTLDAGVRLDAVSGDANGAVRGLSWKTWLPRGMLRWQIFNKDDVAAFAGYRRTAYQAPLNVLAIGDPAAPTADVSTWNGTAAGPLVARVGPGTGGDAAFAQIDPRLERPTTDELVLALRARPRPGLELELARVVKRETSLLGYFDTGVLASEYTAFQVPDPSFVPDSPVGAAQVTALSRPPGSYGRDRYLLSNQTGDPATSWALEATVRATTEKLMLLVGLALTEANGPAAAVGFLATENDQDVAGSMLVDPNALTKARGQLFQDRSHIGKIAAAYHFPSRTTVGAIVRYADGQPFTRLVVAPALTQGPTAVRSYVNGGSAFTFVGTIDLRVQKAFTAGRAEVAAVVDVYNLPNLGNEVIEHVVTGPTFRTPTALQPPRTVLAGLRVTF